MKNKTAIFLVILVVVLAAACQSASELEQAQYYSGGKDLYIAKCQNCHGAKGEGLGKLAPPLTDKHFLTVNKSQLACIIKFGANQPMQINGVNYHEKMPAFNELQSIDTAKLIVYITNSFGNQQGPYKHDLVEEDLKNCQ